MHTSGGETATSYLYACMMQEFPMMLETKASVAVCNSIQSIHGKVVVDKKERKSESTVWYETEAWQSIDILRTGVDEEKIEKESFKYYS